MEYMMIGFSTMIIGFFATAVGLLIILACITLQAVLTQEKPKPVATVPVAQQAVAPSLEPAAAEVIAAVSEPEPEATPISEDTALAAAIMGALSAHLGTSSDKLVVRSIRRAQGWNSAARLEKLS